MSKWVNVKCVAVKEVMVEIEDNETIEDAEKVAAGEMNDYEDFSSHFVEPEHIVHYKQHATECFEI